jgi:peptidoglycan/xylan/chitin deacetylase (PgdA/CDA1 family)/outer membrane protein OmpA-like peptidoglycan-associated protein
MLQAPTTETKVQAEASRTAVKSRPLIDPCTPQTAIGNRAQYIEPGAVHLSSMSRDRQHVTGLQRSIGNQAVLRRLSRRVPVLQTKLMVNQPSNEYEREADRVANQVTSEPRDAAVNLPPTDGAAPTVQRKCSCSGGSCAECAPEATPPHPDEPAIPLAGIPSAEQGILQRSGRALDPATRARAESRLGADFSHVRIHADAEASRSALQLGAAAYTSGRDIVFSAGRYAPGTVSGDRLIAHELVHVMQQDANGDRRSRGTEAEGNAQEKQARDAVSALGWGALKPRYYEVASSSMIAGSARPIPSAFPSPVLSSRASVQRVQLTYDDGPDSAGNTRAVLDALNASGARATFYLVGKRVAQGDNWRVVFDIAAAGHFLGNHAFDWNDATDNHIFLNGTAEERAVKILETEVAIRTALIRGRNDAIQNNKWQSIPQANRDNIEDVIAHGTGRFRTPGFKSKLSADESATAAAIHSASDILAASGLRPLERTMQGTFGFEGVSVDPKDWQKGRTQAEIESSVKKDLSSNDESILLHSRIAATAAATPVIVADISSRKFTFDPTPQGSIGSVKPKPGFANLSTISSPPTASEIAKARAFFKSGIPSFGGFIAGSVAIGIFQMAQLAGAAEVDSFAAEIRTTTVKTPTGPVSLSNWMDAYPDWGTFAIFIDTWRNMKTTPPPPPAPPQPPSPGAVEILFQQDLPHVGSGTDLGPLTPEGRMNLDAVAARLKSDPTLKVQLIGTCSSEQSPEYNYALGQRRAELVAAHLGIDASRLVDPATDDLNAECHHVKIGIVSCGKSGASAAPNAKDRRVLTRFFR